MSDLEKEEEEQKLTWRSGFCIGLTSLIWCIFFSLFLTNTCNERISPEISFNETLLAADVNITDTDNVDYSIYTQTPPINSVDKLEINKTGIYYNDVK